MAFTGTPAVVMISERKARITGLSLSSEASGTIGLHTSVDHPDIKLPAAFKPTPYRESSGAPQISLQDSVIVSFTMDADSETVAPAVKCVKTGTGDLHFLATLTNDGGTTTGGLEIIVEWH